MEEVLQRLKEACRKKTLLHYIQQGELVSFQPPLAGKTTRRWMILKKRAEGRDVPDEDYDSVAPLDNPTAGNWKWGQLQVATYQDVVLPAFRELHALCEGQKGKEEEADEAADDCSFLVILQSPLDPKVQHVLFHGNGVDQGALRIARLKDGDHLQVEYRKEKGVGIFVKTASKQIRDCLLLQYKGAELQHADSSVLIKKVKKKIIDAQVISPPTAAVGGGRGSSSCFILPTAANGGGRGILFIMKVFTPR
jgi:hypothetical protein